MVAIDGGEKKRFSDARTTVFVDGQERPSYRFAAILLGASAFVGGRIDALMRGDYAKSRCGVLVIELVDEKLCVRWQIDRTNDLLSLTHQTPIESRRVGVVSACGTGHLDQEPLARLIRRQTETVPGRRPCGFSEPLTISAGETFGRRPATGSETSAERFW